MGSSNLSYGLRVQHDTLFILSKEHLTNGIFLLVTQHLELLWIVNFLILEGRLFWKKKVYLRAWSNWRESFWSFMSLRTLAHRDCPFLLSRPSLFHRFGVTCVQYLISSITVREPPIEVSQQINGKTLQIWILSKHKSWTRDLDKGKKSWRSTTKLCWLHAFPLTDLSRLFFFLLNISTSRQINNWFAGFSFI